MPLPRVLHVEDDPDIQEIAKIALEIVGGLEVHQFSSGAEAIAAAPGIRPDLFLLDVMMPNMNGEQTLAHLRDLPGFAGTPAIFMTAKAQINEIDALKQLGAAGVIVKPFDPMTLADQLLEIWESTKAG